MEQQAGSPSIGADSKETGQLKNLKDLKDLSLDELWQLFPVVLEEHKLCYRDWYTEEEKRLLGILREFGVCRINHIGSTSVEGLVAKPIIDILLELPSGYPMQQIANTLEGNDWLVMASNEKEEALDLNKGYTPNGFAKKVFHLHVKPLGDPDELYFRDYLCKHSSIAHDYAQLKLSLKDCFEHDRDAYTHAKSDFIKSHTKRAREEFEGRYLPH